jgi:nitroreductase
MELDKAIKERRSVKNYKDKPADWRDVLECIDYARFAPMAGNIYSPRFILVSDSKKIKKIAEACQQDHVAKVKYLVIVCSDKKKTQSSYRKDAEKYIKQQAGAAIQNVLLAIQQKGLSTCWTGHFVEQMIKAELKIPGDVDVEAVLPIGYPHKIARRNKRIIELHKILFYDQWGENRMVPLIKMDV